jgi:hypothetical protein
MAETKHEQSPWPLSPWLGDGAAAQWSLWQAGIEWAALSNWFPDSGTLSPPSDNKDPPADLPHEPPFGPSRPRGE